MTDQTKRKSCTLGRKNNGFEADFALVGDSHVSTLYPLLDTHGIGINKSGLDITLGSCPVFLQSYPSGTLNPVQCRSLQLYFSELMSKGTLPQTLIVGGAWIQWFELEDSRGDTGRAEDVTNSIKKMLANGHKVILIYPVPVLSSDVPKLLLRYLLNHRNILPEAGSIAHADFKSRARVAESALDAVGEHQNLTRIHPENLLCDTILSDRCAAHVDGKPLYSDKHHLSHYGARLLMDKVIEQL